MWTGYGEGKNSKEIQCSKQRQLKEPHFSQTFVGAFFECCDVEKNTLIMLAEQSTYCAYKRGEISVPSQAKSLSMCANYFENILLCVV